MRGAAGSIAPNAHSVAESPCGPRESVDSLRAVHGSDMFLTLDVWFVRRLQGSRAPGVHWRMTVHPTQRRVGRLRWTYGIDVERGGHSRSCC